MDHEELFINAFISPDKRERYLKFLASPKRRKEILERLNHSLDLIPSLSHKVPPAHHTPEELTRYLRSKGAPSSCFVIADRLPIDGKELPLDEAILQIWWHPFGAVASCIPGRLAYYKPESPSPGLLLEHGP